MKTEYNFSAGKRGAIEPQAPGKTRVTIRLDDEILAWFRAQVHAAGGGNYQTLINDALREYILQRREPMEELFRRVCVKSCNTMRREPRNRPLSNKTSWR